MQQDKNESFLRRYQVLVISVALSVVIAVLLIVINLFLYDKISQGLVIRDLGGQQRAATQASLRQLLVMNDDVKTEHGISEQSRKDLATRSALINRIIETFKQGGTLAEYPDKAPLKPREYTADVAASSSQIAKLWKPLDTYIQAVVASPRPDPALLSNAKSYGVTNIDEILRQFDVLVDDTQTDTEAWSAQLATAQKLGAGLVLFNFLFTVLVVFRRLRAGDRAVAQSQKETKDILATVKEGLFLVTNDFAIGSQMSNSLPQVMQRKVEPGMNLIEVMRTMVTPQTLEATRDYLGLLFGKRVKENLVASLNPLSEVPVAGGSDGRGQPQSRYLNFQFNRVQENEDTVYLLVTVSDASERVRLSNEISAAKTRTREEMEALLRVLSRESSEVRLFLHRVGVVLERVNDDLRQAAARRTGTDYSELVNAIFRDVHSLKSEAAALGLDMIEALAHNFEVDLVNLRDRGAVEGSDMVKMTVHLDDMFECVATIRDFLDRMAGNRDASAPQSVVTPSQRAVEGWNTLAERIAREQGKQVQLDLQLQAFDRLPGATLNALRTIGLQLLRNAVVHGIEPAAERQARAKPSVGTVSFRSEDIGSRQVELVVRDDGRGLDVARIRQALIASGRYSVEQLDSLSDRDVIMKIFEPGVSTAEQGDRDAGHGVGMDLVMKQVRSLSGTIALSTKVGAYTEFRIRLPVAESKPVAVGGGAPAPALAAGPADFQLTF